MSDNPYDQPAFPQVIPDSFTLANPGMTLRDWFAGQALAGLLSAAATYGGKTDNRAALAADAYATADAILAERAK